VYGGILAELTKESAVAVLVSDSPPLTAAEIPDRRGQPAGLSIRTT
jgi:hypothetical protein